jgi:hypothetical protein
MARLLDKEWERIQKKAFTRWMNTYATRKGIKIGEDLEDELKNGVKLALFMEAISGDSLGRINKNPRMQIQSIENLNKSINFVKKLGIRLENISSEDIYEGNLKIILGFIWTLILRFQVNDITEGQLRAKEALLLWCQKKTEPYDNVNITNFHMSWKDGLAFCALIHAHRPGLIPYETLTPENDAENLEIAFSAGEALGIPRLIDVEDITDTAKPDELSIIAYVSQLYHLFSSDRRAETAARRVGDLVDFLASIKDLMDEYGVTATDLLNWMREKNGKL